MPENVEDEIVGTLHFAEQYEKRYGLNHPEFFTGTFEDAIKESCLKPAKEVCNIYLYGLHINYNLINIALEIKSVYIVLEEIISRVFASR